MLTWSPTRRLLALVALCGALVLALKFGLGTRREDRAESLEPRSSSSIQAASSPSETSGDSARRSPLPGRPTYPSPFTLEEASSSDRSMERAQVRDFEWRAAQNLTGLIEQAPAILEGDADDARKIALLRVLHESNDARARELVLGALLKLPNRAPRGQVSVPSFLVRYLAQRAGRDASALDTLERSVWSETGTLDQDLRRRAAGYLGAVVGAQDLARIGEHLRRESDPMLVQSMLVALAHNPDAKVPPEFYRALGYEPPVVGTGESEGE